MDDDDYVKGEIEPSWNKKFNVVELNHEVKSVTRDFFKKYKYSTEDAHELSQDLSRKIRDAVVYKGKDKKLRMPRHKIIVQVFMGQKKEQKVSIIAKGYWDNYVDNYTTFTYDDDNFFCTVVVLGFYTD